eukprot:gene15285-biopygen11217
MVSNKDGMTLRNDIATASSERTVARRITACGGDPGDRRTCTRIRREPDAGNAVVSQRVGRRHPRPVRGLAGGEGERAGGRRRDAPCWEEGRCPRPVRVRFFGFYRAARVRSAPAAVPPRSFTGGPPPRGRPRIVLSCFSGTDGHLPCTKDICHPP